MGGQSSGTIARVSVTYEGITIHGEFDRRFVPVARVLAQQIRTYGGGAALAVYLDGTKVVDIWGGVRNLAGDPWRQDTLGLGFSTTKGVTATALHMLVDRGLADYDDPVAQHWPEFAQNGKETITIRQLLTHSAGLYHLRSLVKHFDEARDWDRMAARLAAATPRHRPGLGSGYHALTSGWLLGELVQRLSGMPFGEFVRREIAAPLGADGLIVGVNDNELARTAEIMIERRHIPRPNRSKHRPSLRRRLIRYATHALAHEALEAFYAKGVAKLYTDPEFWKVPIPAANGQFTARSLAHLYAVLGAGGELGGVRLLSRNTIERATQVQVLDRDRVLMFPMHWRLGYHRAGTRTAFGHYGFGGSGAWACPRLGLAVAMIHNANPMGVRAQMRMLGVNRAVLDAVRGKHR